MTFKLSDSQAVNSNRAVEIEKDRQDSTSDDVRVGPILEFESGYSEVFDRPISLAEAAAVKPDTSYADDGAVRVNFAYIDNSTTSQRIRFTLVGNHNAPVQITKITARVVASRAPASGGFVFFAAEGASSIGGLGFNLDSRNKDARTLDGEDHPTEINYFNTQQVNLAKDEPYEFLAMVVAGRAEYDYVLDISFLDGTRQTLMNDGSPWRISAVSPTFETSYISMAADNGGFTTKPCVWPNCQVTR